MIFMACDGTRFDDIDECQAYEDEYLKKKSNQKKRAAEVKDAYKKYLDLRDAYENDFGFGNEVKYFKNLFMI